MKTIIVQNKIDLEKSSQTQESEIIELINNKKNMETIKISTKDRSGIDELVNKINKSVNESKNELPMNIIFESVDNKKN